MKIKKLIYNIMILMSLNIIEKKKVQENFVKDFLAYMDNKIKDYYYQINVQRNLELREEEYMISLIFQKVFVS